MFKRGTYIVYAIGVVTAAPLYAVPVVPNFTQGSMTSTTTQSITTSETINSMDYATGWTYSVSGSGVELESGSTNVAPDVISTQTNTVDGVTSTWSGQIYQHKTNRTGSRPQQEIPSNLQSIKVDQVFRLTQ